jgi:hypothetical protein
MNLQPLFNVQVAEAIGQLRAAPVDFASETCLLLAHSAVFDVDPYTEMFFFPRDTLHLTLIDLRGEVRWTRDLGPGVVPGMWFCPLLPFDLDGDGNDEIYFVGNTDAQHPLALTKYILQRLDPATGETTGQWSWPSHLIGQPLGEAFRHFLIGGYVAGEPVLVTAQGTYGDMHFQAHNADFSTRWTKHIRKNDPGARGSHRCPVVDFENAGREALLWGERYIELDTGRERFCADRKSYRGHSDLIEPIRHNDNTWSFFTARESDPHTAPRVVCFDQNGKRQWAAIDRGHMDMGYVARLLDSRRHAAIAMRIDHKTCGPDGRAHAAVEPFMFNADTGQPLDPPIDLYQTQPIDFNGDGYHELVRAQPGADGAVFDRHGNALGSVQGPCALLQKVTGNGEQALVYHPDGRVQLWADLDASDTPEALSRFEHPLYRRNAKLMSTGSNLGILGGL